VSFVIFFGEILLTICSTVMLATKRSSYCWNWENAYSFLLYWQTKDFINAEQL